MIHDRLDPRLVVGPPVVGPHERAFFVRHVAPDDETVQPGTGRVDRRHRAVEVEPADAFEHGPQSFRLQGHPHHVALRADEPRHALRALAHAAVDGDIGPERLDRLHPGRRVPLEAVAHARNLVVARREETPAVARIVELGRFEFLQRIDLPGDELRHGAIELLPHDCSVARLDYDFVGRLLDRLERADPGVHVRHRGDPIQVVVVIWVGVLRQVSSFRHRRMKPPQKKSLIGTRSGSSCRSASSVCASFRSVLSFRVAEAEAVPVVSNIPMVYDLVILVGAEVPTGNIGPE